MVSNSRAITPESLAAEVGMDASKLAEIEQRSIDERIEAIIGQAGKLSNTREGREGQGDVAVGGINEFALSAILALFLRGSLIFDRIASQFYSYDSVSGVHRPVTKSEVERTLAEAYVQLPGFSPKLLSPLGFRPPSVRVMRGTREAFAAQVGVNFPFGGDPDFVPVECKLPVANGLLTLDLQSRGKHHFREGFCASDRTPHRAPLLYDPTCGDRPSRLLDELLSPTLGSEELADAYLDDFAASVFGGAALSPFVFAMIGASGAGKSQIVEILRAIVGRPFWCALSARDIGGKFGSSFLGLAKVVSFTDAKGCALGGETGEVTKALTGGDYREDRMPHASLLTPIKGDKIFLLVANSSPQIDLDDDAAAWERRLRVWRFHQYEPVRRIQNFGAEILKSEGSQLLNRLILGFHRRNALRLDGVRPEVPDAMKAEIDNILRRSCPVFEFLSSRLTKERGCSLSFSDLWATFHDSLPPYQQRDFTQREFTKRAKECAKRIFGVADSNSVEGGERGLRSVRWKTEVERSED